MRAFARGWGDVHAPGALYAAAVVLPSLAALDRFGAAVEGAYALAAGALIAALSSSFERIAERIDRRTALALSVCGLLVLLTVVAYVYPAVDGRKVSGLGSDADDALDLACSALLRGEYPYRARTYLGNPISPMPGGVLLTAPIVALAGSSAWALPVWTALGFVILARRTGDLSRALVLFAPFVLSPAYALCLVAGSDYVSNGLAVAIFSSLVLDARRRCFDERRFGRRTATAATYAWAVVLGVAVAWRANFVFVLPPLVAALARSTRWRDAIAVAAVVSFSAAAVSLPFYLYEPESFSPPHVRAKLALLDDVLPHAGAILAVATAMTALLVAASTRSRRRFFSGAAVVLFAPILAAAFLDCLHEGRYTPAYLSFGAMAMPMGAFAAWWTLVEPRPRAAIEVPIVP